MNSNGWKILKEMVIPILHPIIMVGGFQLFFSKSKLKCEEKAESVGNSYFISSN